MEHKHKKFNPYDRVLVRGCSVSPWDIELYSHYNKEQKRHETMCHYCDDSNLLPYEGNEHLVGTTDEPEEEVKLEKGEYVICFDNIEKLNEKDLEFRKFVCIEGNKFFTNHLYWTYAIRFSDFNPNDMKETRKHILCVRKGKVVRYKEGEV